MDAALVLMLEDGIDEGRVRLVVLPDLQNLASDGVTVAAQKPLGETGRLGFLGLLVLKAQTLEDLGKALGVPRLEVHAGLAMHLLQKGFLLALEKGLGRLGLFHIHPDAAPPHLEHHGQQREFQLQYLLAVLFLQLSMEDAP